MDDRVFAVSGEGWGGYGRGWRWSLESSMGM